MPEFTLYGFSESGNSYKPALMLELCKADWEIRRVAYFSGETRSPELARAEPRRVGKIDLEQPGSAHRIGCRLDLGQASLQIAVESVVAPVAVDETALVGESVLGGVDRRQQAGIVGRQETDVRVDRLQGGGGESCGGN